jgi:hypothetical protein
MIEAITSRVTGILTPLNLIIIICVLGVGFFIFMMPKKPYCKVKLKEKRGNNYIDHFKLYNAHIRKLKNSETGAMIQWLEVCKPSTLFGVIPTEKKFAIWRVPSGEDFTLNNAGQRLVELVWLGGNSFRIYKMNNHFCDIVKEDIFKKSIKKDGNGVFKRIENEKLYRLKKCERENLQIVPENMKYQEFKIRAQLEQLASTKTWWDDFKQHLPFIAAMFFAIIVVYLMNDTYGERLDDAVVAFEDASDKLVQYNDNINSRPIDNQVTVRSDLNGQERTT